jgi:hypothetical protein
VVLAGLSLALAFSCARREAKNGQPALPSPSAQGQVPAVAKEIPPPDPKALAAFVGLFPELAPPCEIGGAGASSVSLDRDSVEGILGWEGPPWREPEPAASEDAGESQGPIGDADYAPERSFGFYALGRLALRDRLYLVISRNLMIYDAYRGPRPEQSEECRVYSLDSKGRTTAMASLSSREIPQGSPGDGFEGPEPATIRYEDDVFRMSQVWPGQDTENEAIWTVTILADGKFEEKTERVPTLGDGK